MPDNNNINDVISGLGETSYIPQEKKGAPQVEAPVLDDILAPPPAAWTGNAEKLGKPKVDEPVLLDDPAQTTWQNASAKLGKPQIEAPQLDDGTSYTQQQTSAPQVNPDLERARAAAASLLDDAPAAYDPVEEFYQKLQFTDDLKAAFGQLPADKQQQVVEMRAGQLGIAVPKIPKQLLPEPPAEEKVSAEDVVLEEAPEVKEYVPTFQDQDLERIKEESKKPQKYTPPPVEMTEEQKKEGRRIMNELREDREREQAQKGFKILILLAVLGVVGAVCLTMFFSGAFGLGYTLEDELGWMKMIKDNAIYVGVIMGIGSVLLVAPVPQLKSVVKLVDCVCTILMLFPGVPMLIQKAPGHGLLNGILYAAALGIAGFSAFSLITNENIEMYNKHGNA